MIICKIVSRNLTFIVLMLGKWSIFLVFFGKSDFFPKISNLCQISLPPAKTYWMITYKSKKKSPQFVSTLHSYIMQICWKQILRPFSKFTWVPKKFQKLLWAHRPSKPTIDFLEMPIPMGGFLCLLLRQDVKYKSFVNWDKCEIGSIF